MITQDLERTIIESEDFDESLILENGSLPVFVLLEKFMEKKKITKAVLIKKLNVERTYGYQLLNGTRNPTREYLIRICLIMQLDLEDTQKVLKAACKNILYARNVEDARAIYAIEHRMSYEKAVEFIWNAD